MNGFGLKQEYHELVIAITPRVMNGFGDQLKTKNSYVVYN